MSIEKGQETRESKGSSACGERLSCSKPKDFCCDEEQVRRKSQTAPDRTRPKEMIAMRRPNRNEATW